MKKRASLMLEKIFLLKDFFYRQKFLKNKKAVFFTAGLAGLFLIVLIFALPALLAPSAPVSEKNSAIHTSLFPLSVKKLDHSSLLSYNFNRLRWGRGGSITKIGNNALIQNNINIFHLDFDTQNITRLDIMPPENGISQMRDHVGIRQFVKTNRPRIKVHQMHRQALIAIKRAKKTTLLISYNYWNPQNLCYSLRLARMDFPAEQNPLDWTAQADDWKVIFETSPCIKLEDHQHHFRGNQSGGRMILSDKQGHILMTIGDFGCDGRSAADAPILQKANSDYGRIVEINIDNGQKTNISIGHRNPQGIARGKDGKIWSTEHGPRGGDELNLIQKGKNYGWPFTTYGTAYGTHVWPPAKRQGRHDRYQKPVFAFVPSIGISNLAVIDDFAPEWDGDLLVASLARQTLYRMRIVDGRVILAEPIHLGVRIRYIYNHGDGRLLALDDRMSVYIMKQKNIPPEMSAAATISAPAELVKAAQSEWNRCIVCHGTGATSTNTAPTLWGIFNRRIGQSDFRHYSPDMKSSRQRWTRKNLAAFLTQPDAVFEETTMPDPDIDDPRIIKAIINHLATLKP